MSRAVRVLRLSAIVSELEELLLAQTNLTQEKSNLMRFRALVADQSFRFMSTDTIVVPDAFEALSTDAVLVMEFIRGVDPYDHAQLQIDPRQLAKRVDFLLDQMIMYTGVMHADLHPGNFFWNTDGQIVLVDFGLIHELDRDMREHVLTAIYAIVDGYIDFAVRYLLKYFIVKFDGAPLSPLEVAAAYDAVYPIIHEHAIASKGQPRFGSMLSQLLKTLSVRELCLTSAYTKIFLTIITVDGYMYALDPTFDTIENMREKRLQMAEYNAVPVAAEKLVLGESGTYSAAMFRASVDPQQAYVAAQDFAIDALCAPPGAVVMNVGCGRGHLLRRMQDRGIDCFGITVSDFEARVCRDKGVESIHSSWERFTPGSPGYRKVHSLAGVEVLTHLSSLQENREGLTGLKLNRFMEWASDVLHEGGTLFLQEIVVSEALLHDPRHGELYREACEALPFIGFIQFEDVKTAAARHFDTVRMSDDSVDLVPTYRAWKAGVDAHREEIRAHVNSTIFAYLLREIDIMLRLSEAGLVSLYRMQFVKCEKVTAIAV